MTTLAIDVFGAFLWDRLLLGIFAFPILKASMANTTKKDVMVMIRTLSICFVIVSYFANQDYSAIMEELERQEQEAKNASLTSIPYNAI